MDGVAILIYFSPSLFFFEISSRFCPQVLPVTLDSGGVEVQSLELVALQTEGYQLQLLSTGHGIVCSHNLRVEPTIALFTSRKRCISLVGKLDKGR